MDDSNLKRAFFLLILVVITAAFVWLIRDFTQPIFWAVALAIVFYPGHALIQRRLPERPATAAAISVIIVLFVVVLPIIAIVAAVTGEASDLYQSMRDGDVSITGIYSQLTERIPQVSALVTSLGIDVEQISSQLTSSAISISQFLATSALQIGQDTLRITVFFFLMLYLLFFCLKDGHAILEELIRAVPIGDERERRFLDRFAEVSRATIKGTLVIGIVQGTIGGIAFALIGIQAPVLWGVAMALLSIVPAVGPALVWVPATIILAFEGRLLAAAALFVVGALIISLVDNLLRPILVGRDTRMPDYLVLLSTLGGLTAFGLAGVVVGPIIAAFFLTVWAMAAEEFENFDHA
jgi:predicted PurR-regulated permease PerM